MKNYIMALDQGTTSSRCILFNEQGNICAIAQKEFAQHYPQPGWVEHDPMEIWSSQLAVVTEAMSKERITSEQIAGIGITNQRETTVVWNRHTGTPVYPAIVWQCRRTAEQIEQLKEDGMEAYIREKTGLIADAYFSASKIAWILEHVEGAREAAQKGDLLFGTIDTWLIWNLTDGKVHATDRTNASRTMMYDIHRLAWDEKILDYFHIPACMLPKVCPSSGDFGVTEAFGKEIPICGVAGDQQSALFGQSCFQAGQVKNTYGTGCFLLMNTGERAVKSQNGLLTTIAASAGDQVQYALEGSVFVAGAAVQWLRDEMQLVQHASETEAVSEQVGDSNGIYVVPAFTGLGAPYWNQYARGIVTGLTRGVNRSHLVRATLESMAYQTQDVLRAMEQDSGISLQSLKVDGGASNNNFLMQFQADIMDVQVIRPECTETTALGAAYLAGLSVGFWHGLEEIRNNWKLSHTFLPHMKEEERLALCKGWKKAVRCALAWAEEE